MNHERSERRVERTREAIFRAFRDLVLTVGYDSITVRDVIKRANVGRSTIYEHFENKEQLLGESLGPLLRALGSVDDGPASIARVASVLQHFCENREINDRFFAGSMASVVTGFLASAIELDLKRRPHRGADVPLSLAAATLAAAEIAFVRAWVGAKNAIGAETAAARLCATAVAGASALLGGKDAPARM